MPAVVELYWIPLGAGSPLVQASGRLFESIAARRQRRASCDLYHAALQLHAGERRYSVEQAPVPDDNGAARGVVAVGPVGLRVAGRLRWFRYEVRCWPDGIIPDIGYAVDSPVPLSADSELAWRILDVLPAIPTPIWGRDEARTGDMWNSNSVVSWALTRAGIDTSSIEPPAGGRAPGWRAGIAVAATPATPPRYGRLASSSERPKGCQRS